MSDLHSETSAFVAKNMIPQSSAPQSEVGFMGWVRKNLFATVGDTITTLISLIFVAYIVWTFAPWFIFGVWNAGSLAECREILDGVHAACFAVLKVRFNQLVFGFYPETELWRPTLALLLFVPAVIPVLGDGWVRKLMPLSLLYPLLAFFLVWGGPIWGIVAFLISLAVGALAFQVASRFTSSALAAIVALLVTVLFWLYGIEPTAALLNSIFGFVGLESVDSAQLGGILLAMIVGVSGIVLSFPLGILLALGRQSNLPIVKMICVGFIEFIRGVPLITLLFVASTLLNYFLPPGVSFDLLLRVVILVTLFASAYMAEVIRGGLAALPRGQYEAAQSMGLPYWDSMRLIILPQALKVAIPGIVSTFIGLFKDTTLVSIIGLYDLLGIRNAITSDPNWTGIFWELLVFAAVFFWICCFSMSRYSMYVERKLDTGHR